MRRALLAALALGLVAAGSALAIDPRAAVIGWLVAFVTVGGIPVGALAWCLIAILSHARWSAPLVPIARALPVLLVAALPLAVAAFWIVPPAHLDVYLWPPLLIARSYAALAWWSWLAFRLRGLTRTGAALALTLHAVLVSMLACDWLLVVEPGHAATVAGMVLAVVQFLGGAAAAVLLGVGDADARRDLSRLLIAPVLALVYMLYMDWLIVWFGNLPEHVGWYVDRLQGGWIAVPFVATLAVPGTIAAVALGRLRLAGAVALAGAVVGMGWWLGGYAGGWLWLALCGAGVAIAASLRMGEPARG